ncbi:PKD-like domain-containing protein [Candidatus Protochlamydia phocaeensis]|uniref:PKD-like domain-containing protein n=1 Tax=Candidatus Protochlamydia phocaeensis TaxID=1414722 RepID=UPI0008396DDB|nr:PKD-like domain-containing protein [Candidatus Protochlamydia phocaeensis]
MILFFLCWNCLQAACDLTFIATAAGGSHSLALRNDGTVWAWGRNFNGQLGDGTTLDSSLPVQVGGGTPLTGVIAIAGGGSHSLALKNDGTVWAWGNNGNGELGDGTSIDSPIPVQVGGGGPFTNAIDIAAGNFHSLALRSDGSVWAWGDNGGGALGNGTFIDSSIPVETIFTPVAIATPANQTIVSGGTTSIALSTNLPGTIFSWEVNQIGTLGTANGIGTTINQTLVTTGNTPGTATYTVTPITSQGCIGTPIQVVVTVEPLPPSLVITSLHTANFAVGQPSSFIVTAIGSPTPSIVAIGKLPAGLIFVDNGNGTATLFGTPVNGTQGIYSLTIIASNGIAPNAMQNFTLIILSGGGVKPPRHVKGFQEISLCKKHADFVNILTWKASAGSGAAAYYIYRNSLNHLVKIVPSGEPLQFEDPHRKPGRTYTYFIVAADGGGNISEPIRLVVRPLGE